MKILKNGTVMKWMAYGMFIAALLCACGLIAIPAVVQLCKGEKADQVPRVDASGPVTEICVIRDDGTKQCSSQSGTTSTPPVIDGYDLNRQPVP